MFKSYKDYLHGSKEESAAKAEEIGHEEGTEAYEYFKYSLYEIELDMIADTDTGKTWICAVNGVSLEKPVKG